MLPTIIKEKMIKNSWLGSHVKERDDSECLREQVVIRVIRRQGEKALRQLVVVPVI